MICDKSKQVINYILEGDKPAILEVLKEFIIIKGNRIYNVDGLQVGNFVHVGGYNNYHRTHIGFNFTIGEDKYALNIANPEYEGDKIVFSNLCKLGDDGKIFIKSEIIGLGYDLDSIFEMSKL